MKFETKLRRISKQTTPQSESPEQSDIYTFKFRYYDPNTKSFGYVTRIESKYY